MTEREGENVPFSTLWELSESFILEANLACQLSTRPVKPTDRQSLVDYLLGHSSGRTNTALRLAAEGHIIDALILLRSVLDTSARAWRVMLADSNDKSVEEFCNLATASELRRMRSSAKRAENEAKPLGNSDALRYFGLLQEKTFSPENNMSAKVRNEFAKQWSFSSCLLKAKEGSQRNALDLNLSFLEIFYSHLSSLSHGGAVGAILSDILSENPHNQTRAFTHEYQALICGILVLTWYFSVIFYSIFNELPSRGLEKIYADARGILQFVGAFTEKNLNDFGIP